MGVGQVEMSNQMKFVSDVVLDCLKVVAPFGSYLTLIKTGVLALITLSQLRDMVQILGGFVAIFCTVWVARSTVAKNRRL